MAENLEHIKAILTEALEKETEAERKAYLDEVCGADADLRAEVESLLHSHDDAGDFLDASPFGANVTLDAPPISEGPGAVIGRYKLLEQIGEGGFGVVYMADQTKPISRRVALKIIKLGMDTKEVIARFEAERQALAMMEHPNIAKVLDAGATESGRPYFVMELVKGIPITDYCDRNNLDTQERLELFIDVCKAIQHAHQKGIIHRDLKPSNVLITLHDGRPVPKVIDFGIAKATGQRLTEKTLFTRFAHMIGTPEYMSPEQAEFSGLDVDARSDIYSLGVLLYQLLTGVTPFDAEKLREAGYSEMQRIIREDEPDKPSTRLSVMGEALTDVARHRKASPDTLQKVVRGDLDWIVMKTLEKDRTRRYERAVELAADIQRHLSHQPVLAVAPSVSYKLHKFVRRNRVAVITCSLIAGALAVGATIATLALLGAGRLTEMVEQPEPVSIGPPQLEQPDVGVELQDVWGYQGLEELEVTNISRDGRYCAHVDLETSGLMVRDLSTGKDQRLADINVPSNDVHISPDNKWVVYVGGDREEQKHDVRIVGIEGNQGRILYPAKEGNRIFLHGWSPDSQSVLATFYDTGDKRVGLNSLPVRIAVVAVADGSVRVLKSLTPEENDDPVPRFSPDGRYVAYGRMMDTASEQEDIFLIPLGGGPEIHLIEHPADDDVLGWLPHGNDLLFRSDRGGEGDDAWMIEAVDGKSPGVPRLIKKDIPNSIEGPVRTPTGDWAFYYRGREPGKFVLMGGAYTATLDPDAGKVLAAPEMISEPALGRERVQSPDFSRDGKYLAYYVAPTAERTPQGMRYGPGSIVIRSFETGEEREITFSPKFSAGGGLPILRWSPDGRAILIGGRSEAGQSGVFEVDVMTGRLSPLTLDPPETVTLDNWQLGNDSDLKEGDYVSWGEWSPDGKAILYGYFHLKPDAPPLGRRTHWRVMMRDLETGKEKEVCRNPEGEVGFAHFAVSPDGTRLVIWTRNALWICPTSGGEPRELLKERVVLFRVTWMPDSRHLLFLKGSRPPGAPELWRIAAEGGEPERVAALTVAFGPNVHQLRVHPDGRRIAFVALGPASQYRTRMSAPQYRTRMLRIVESAERLKAICTANLDAVWRAMRQYERDHGDMPEHLFSLYPKYLQQPSLLVCPAYNERQRRSHIFNDPAVRSSYQYIRGGAPRPVRLAGTALPISMPDAQQMTKPQVLKLRLKYFGDVSGLVECTHHDPHLQLAYNGNIYEAESWSSSPQAEEGLLNQLQAAMESRPETWIEDYNIPRLVSLFEDRSRLTEVFQAYIKTHTGDASASAKQALAESQKVRFITCSEDDAKEKEDGRIDLDSSLLNVFALNGQGNQAVGLRFTDVRVPQGARIKRAYVQFRSTGFVRATQNEGLIFHGELAADAASFQDIKGNITSRRRTVASVECTAQIWDPRSGNDRTSDLTSIIQEIVAQPDWREGNALVLIISGSSQGMASSWDRNRRQGPMLYVDF